MGALITRREWGARDPRPGPGPLDPTKVLGVALHWPAIVSPIHGFDNVARALRGWQAYHMDGKGWSDIAYQRAYDQNGNRYQLRGIVTQSGANGDQTVNEQYGAFLLILAPGEKPSRAMRRAVRRDVALFRNAFTRGLLVVGHSQVRPEPTACPGPDVLEAIKDGAFEPRETTRGKMIDAALAALDKARGTGDRLRRIRAARRALRGIEPL